jgi:hypothetical protein
VPRDDGVAGRLDLAVEDVEVGPAHAAGVDVEEHVAVGRRLRIRALDEPQRLVRVRELHDLHAAIMAAWPSSRTCRSRWTTWPA